MQRTGLKRREGAELVRRSANERALDLKVGECCTSAPPVHVFDRHADRIQVFTPEGKFVREAWYAKDTLGSGSTWDLAFSKDPQQRYIYLADGTNEKVRVILRETTRSSPTSATAAAAGAVLRRAHR